MHRDNHYVPRSYLKNWTADGASIWSYRVLVPHERVPLWRRTSTRGLAYHEHLYTRAVAAGESDAIERWLDAEFEAPAEEAIAKVISDRRLTPRDWLVLARFFAAQDVRTPARLTEQMLRWSSTVPELIRDTMQKSVAKLEAMTPSQRAALSSTVGKQDDVPFRVTVEQSPGETDGWLRGETVLGRSLWLWSMRRLLSGEALRALCRHRWTILAPPEGTEWPTSDDPAIKLNFKSSREYDFRGGWGSAGTDLLLPLSPQHLLFTQVGKKVPRRGHRMPIESAGLVRRLIVEHAHRYVFASGPDSSVAEMRPRTVDGLQLRKEQQQWARWHAEQLAAERALLRR